MDNLDDLSFEQIKQIMGSQIRETFKRFAFSAMFGEGKVVSTGATWPDTADNKKAEMYYSASREQAMGYKVTWEPMPTKAKDLILNGKCKTVQEHEE